MASTASPMSIFGGPEADLTIKLDAQTEEYLIGSVQRFFSEELDDDIGILKAGLVLEFFIREVGPSVYNQAIADAQQSLERAVSDLSGARFEPEFDYWRKHA
jgi:uncharacterized protein (DUF2164 family)